MNNHSKIISTILISFLFNSIILKAHNYIPIPEDSTVRWVMYHDYYDQGVCEETNLFNYRIAGDTSINGTNYKKVYAENNILIQNSAGIHGCGYPINGYLHAFRQDTVLKKCYLVPRDSINEQLIYDFSLQVNDTLHNPYLKPPFVIGCDSILTLHSLDSVLINNQYRLRQNFNCGDYIVEGIGWLTDPFMIGLTNYRFICMKKDTALLYMNFLGLSLYCSWLPTNIKIPDDKSHISIKTSIDRSEIQIVCDQIISNIETFDLTGRKIYAADNKTTSINLDTFSFPDFIIMKVLLKDNSIVIKKLFLK